MFVAKYSAWSYENEIRIFKSKKTKGKISITPAALRSVTFGNKTPLEHKERIKEILSDRSHIEFKQCQLDDKYYKLNIVKEK